MESTFARLFQPEANSMKLVFLQNLFYKLPYFVGMPWTIFSVFTKEFMGTFNWRKCPWISQLQAKASTEKHFLQIGNCYYQDSEKDL